MSETQGRFVRPYAITGGRTSVDGPPLELESQIAATDRGRANQHRYRWEAAHVIAACDSATALIDRYERSRHSRESMEALGAILPGEGGSRVESLVITLQTNSNLALVRHWKGSKDGDAAQPEID